MVSTASLIIPTLLAGVALFFASFLSWMVLQLHRQDWVRLDREDQFLDSLRQIAPQPGSYMFPLVSQPAEQNSPEFKQKVAQGPIGVLTIFPGVSMGRNLGLTMLFFVVTSYCIGYLATLGLPSGADFMQVFRFVSTASLLTYVAAIVQHAIWFRCRITGHLVESIAYAAITGAIFASFWPSA